MVEVGDDSFPLSIDGNILTFEWEEGLQDEFEEDGFEDDDMDPRMLLTLLGIPEPEYVISVDLPGEIIDHNADEQNGSLLTWEIDIFESIEGSADFPFTKNISKASEDFTGGGMRILWIIVGIVAVIFVLFFCEIRSEPAI